MLFPQQHIDVRVQLGKLTQHGREHGRMEVDGAQSDAPAGPAQANARGLCIESIGGGQELVRPHKDTMASSRELYWTTEAIEHLEAESCLSCWIWSLRLGCVVPRLRAATRNPPCWAMAANDRRWRRLHDRQILS